MEWQTIGEAPVDGTEFLALYSKQGNTMLIVRFDKINGYFISKGEPLLGFSNNATHWMPLPEPPK